MLVHRTSPKLGLAARQLDDLHHQAEDRDDKRRGAEYQCYDNCRIYIYHLLTGAPGWRPQVAISCKSRRGHRQKTRPGDP